MNWGMLGHEWAVNLLKEHIVQGQTRHAYLISGSPGVGRRTLALRFARALNCLEPPELGESCGDCRVCLQIERMQHPDLAIVQAEQLGGTLKVDQVRELQRSIALTPYEAQYKVAILLRFEEANANAMNALLKTLEEPPNHVVVVLTADCPDSLLPTIVSRCEVIRLRPLPFEQVKKGLQDLWALKPDDASRFAHISVGRPGYAIRLNQEPELLENHQEWLDDHRRLLSAGRLERFAYAEVKSKDKETLRLILLTWLSFWRDILLKAAGSTIPIANLDHAVEIDELAARFGLVRSQQVVFSLENTLDLLDKNINTRLATDVLMLDLPI